MHILRIVLLSLVLFSTTQQALRAQYWTHVGVGSAALNANGTIHSICADTGNVLYAAGIFTDGPSDTSGYYYVARWNGTTWEDLAANALHADGHIYAICVDPDHNVYAAGYFKNDSGKFYVAKWNVATGAWTELGAGLSALNANGAIMSICSDAAGNIYAAGIFTNASGYCYVAKWDVSSSSWSETGAGVSPLIAGGYILTICSGKYGDIYAAGLFENGIGGYVAKWDGTTWSSLGTGGDALNANGGIFAACTDEDNNVYAGGCFRNADHKEYVARWSYPTGPTWTELGGSNALGVTYCIATITADKYGNIYAAGIFGSGGKCYVAKWDGISWSELGTGANALNANASILTICTDAKGNLYAAGGFRDSVIYAAGHCYVAKWVNSLSGIPQQENNSNVAVYPNPTQGAVTIIVPQGDGWSADVTDITGRRVSHVDLVIATAPVQVATQPGIYLVTISNSVTHERVTRKMVVK
jgi:hypothetical protein